ncbi:MAG TPA: ornithine cyclodeaminase family protein [Mogibacterium sp.]|nr:ornithine cyclodeaminase family protein [Mogibacterium sp.]
MYKATQSQFEAFEKQHEYFKTKLNLGKEVLWLTKEECIQCGPTIEETLEIVKKTMIEHGKNEYEMPAKVGIHPYDDVFFHAMPAYVPGSIAAGIKWIECYPRNPVQYNLPQTTGLQIMNDIPTGVPVAIMDCTWLTAMRTPAVTSLAAEALHPDAEYFGMFGCGVQGREHVRYIVKTLKKLKKIYVSDVREEVADKLIADIMPEIGIEIVKGTPQEIAKKCDVMSSATIILREPLGVVKDEWISPGQTIIPCDMNTFFDLKAQYRADKYIVDSIDEHQLFADMGYFPADKGLPKVYAQTGEILGGLKPGRESKDELIVCSNIGISVNDIAMGQAILSNALEKGVGKMLPL